MTRVAVLNSLLLLALMCALRPSDVSAQPDAASREERRAGPTATALHLDKLEAAVRSRINEVRTAHGVSELVASDALTRLARRHCEDMAAHDFFDHTNMRGQRITERAHRTGVRCDVGENLYQTYQYDSYQTIYTGNRVDVAYDWKNELRIADDAVQAWLASPPHRATLLNPAFSYQGIGVAVTDAFKIFITQNVCP